MYLWFGVLAMVAWAVSGARSKTDRRLAVAVPGTALVIGWLLRFSVATPNRFAANLLLAAAVTAVAVVVGNHVRKRAMQAVIDGVEEDG